MKTCPFCANIHNRRGIYCSDKHQRIAWERRQGWEDRTCEVCRGPFQTRPRYERVTCCQSCAVRLGHRTREIHNL